MYSFKFNSYNLSNYSQYIYIYIYWTTQYPPLHNYVVFIIITKLKNVFFNNKKTILTQSGMKTCTLYISGVNVLSHLSQGNAWIKYKSLIQEMHWIESNINWNFEQFFCKKAKQPMLELLSLCLSPRGRYIGKPLYSVQRL